MTIKSIVELLAEADANLPDNNTQLISAADVRQLIKNVCDTLSPAYGAITLESLAKALTTTPSAISPFLTNVAATAGYYANSLANGRVARWIATAGIAGATDFFIVTGGVQGPNNNNVLLEVYKNGVATGYKTSVTCSGAGDTQGFNIAGISYTASVDAEYEVRASAPAGNYTFIDVTIIVQAQPVRSFT